MFLVESGLVAAGVSFTTFTSYGIAKADKNNDVELIMSGESKDVGLSLKNYFGLKKLAISM
ncbi:hypothetical protein HSACCH_02542 [Halanaerobium saccharolyticum subsp. saccharolyticum DSM 6643]|uniref:Uncharacterized protein n=1 Tax=Halanaerobium saccharolyticum subsp. saccharolyticum DSM 6643 TaxID=1293054 RepID=M5E4U7_9FIRM|nr:hypothetical protein [Halanaerobium saccharolyticum]CCU81049.1 hypothetical protein HSACCH_02542 [Halanaerobium saccharolyticum subsp. saccharolyticum DSM 6643]